MGTNDGKYPPHWNKVLQMNWLWFESCTQFFFLADPSNSTIKHTSCMKVSFWWVWGELGLERVKNLPSYKQWKTSLCLQTLGLGSGVRFSTGFFILLIKAFLSSNKDGVTRQVARKESEIILGEWWNNGRKNIYMHWKHRGKQCQTWPAGQTKFFRVGQSFQHNRWKFSGGQFCCWHVFILG